MSDLGAPSSYLLLKPGVAVVASDDVHVGTVGRVLADPEIDIFDGIVVSTVDGERLVAGAQVHEIYDNGVELTIDAAAVAALSRPR